MVKKTIEEPKKTTTPNAEEYAKQFDHLQGDGLGGFEDMGADTIAFPFIKILQQLSPQCKKNKPEYIADAEPGMLYNNVTNTVFETPVEVVVGRFDHYYIAWKPERAGYAGAQSPEEIVARMQNGSLKRDDNNRIYDPETKYTYSETYLYYVVFPDNMEEGVCLLSLSSTQLKEAKRWNRLLLSTFLPGTNRRAQPYFMRWNITTPEMSNDKGDWFGFKIDFAGFVNKETLELVCDERKALPATTKPDLALLEAGPSDAMEAEYSTNESKF